MSWRVEDRLLDPDAGVERALEHVAGAQVAQLGAHERPALAGLDVLELDDLEQPVVELERDPVLQVVGGDGRHGASFGQVGQPAAAVRGDDDEVLDADAAEAATIEAGFDGHDVPGDAVRRRDRASDERVLVDQQADAVAGAVEEPVAVPGVGEHVAARRVDVAAPTPAPTAARPASWAASTRS